MDNNIHTSILWNWESATVVLRLVDFWQLSHFERKLKELDHLHMKKSKIFLIFPTTFSHSFLGLQKSAHHICIWHNQYGFGHIYNLAPAPLVWAGAQGLAGERPPCDVSDYSHFPLKHPAEPQGASFPPCSLLWIWFPFPGEKFWSVAGPRCCSLTTFPISPPLYLQSWHIQNWV